MAFLDFDNYMYKFKCISWARIMYMYLFSVLIFKFQYPAAFSGKPITLVSKC